MGSISVLGIAQKREKMLKTGLPCAGQEKGIAEDYTLCTFELHKATLCSSYALVMHEYINPKAFMLIIFHQIFHRAFDIYILSLLHFIRGLHTAVSLFDSWHCLPRQHCRLTLWKYHCILV